MERLMRNAVLAIDAEIAKRQQQIDQLTQARNAIRGLDGKAPGRSLGRPLGPRRVLSVSARKRIAAAQRARWAAYHAKQRR